MISRIFNSVMGQNGFFSIVRLVFSLISGFAIYFFVFDSKWTELYGMWVMLLSTFLLGKVLDITGGQIATKFVSAASDLQEKQTVISTVIIMTLTISTVTAALISLLIKYLPEFFPNSPHLNVLIIYCAVLTVTNNLNSAMVGLIDGLFQSRVSALASICSAIVFVTLLWHGATIQNIEVFFFSFIAQSLTNFMAMLIFLITRYKIWRGFRTISHTWIFEISSYGIKHQIQSMVGLSYDTLPKLVVAKIEGLIQVVEYELLFKIASMTNLLIQTLFVSFFPMISAQSSIEAAETIYKKYRVLYNTTSTAIFLVVFSLVGIYINSTNSVHLMLTIWMFIAWWTMSLANYRLSFLLARSCWRRVFEFYAFLFILVLIGITTTFNTNINAMYVAPISILASAMLFLMRLSNEN